MEDGKGEWTVNVFGTKQTFEIECNPIFEDGSNLRYILKIFPKNKTQIKKKILVIMLNPSKASEKKSDPTCRTLINLCDWNNYNSITIWNIYPWRSQKVGKFQCDNELEIEANDKKLGEYIVKFKEVLCAWGKANGIWNRNSYDARVQKVIKNLNNKKLKKLGSDLVDGKYPHHPLYYFFQKGKWNRYKIRFEEFR